MTEAALQDPLIGTIIADRYRVDAKIGDGGMGAVYRVEHTHMRKRLALKVLHHDLSAYPEIVARFEREAMAAANIEHPNVANATDFGKLADGTFYLVLEYVEGMDLRQLLQRDRVLDPARAVHITLQILGALGRAHELGIVHRDLKPENILLVEKDHDPEFVKVLDFGIARVPVGELGRPSMHPGDSKPLTRAGTVYGTPEYMAPEQALGHVVDGRADLYALGVLLFEMLAGARPFDDTDKVALLGAHVSKPIPSLSKRSKQFIPEGLEELVTRSLAKQPEDRFQSAADFASALFDLGFDAPLPITRHPSRSGERAAERGDAFALVDRPSGRMRVEEPAKSVPIDIVPPATPEAPPPQSVAVAEPPRPSRIPWVIALLSVLGAAAVVSFVLRRPPETTVVVAPPPPPATSSVAPVASSATAPAPSASTDTKELALRALGRVASGEVDAGLKELEALVVANPSDPMILRATAQAYGKAQKPADELATLKKLVAVSPDAFAEPQVAPLFVDTLADAKVADDAIATLASSKEGAKLLYQLAFDDKTPVVARNRAARALRDAKHAKTLPAAIRTLAELRSATTCPAKKAVLDKKKQDLDAEALPVLTAMAKPNCGADHKQPCWPCIKDLDAVIKDVTNKK